MMSSTPYLVSYQRDPDEWFAALDRRWITTEAGQWVTQILGIHSEGGEHWIQIGRADQAESSLILHVTDRTTVTAAVAALSSAPLPEVAGVEVVDAQRAA